MGCRRQGVSGSKPTANTLADPKSLSDRDLLAALLGGWYCRRKKRSSSDQELAAELLEEHGSLLALMKTRGGLIGVEEREVLFPVAAAFEVACRIAKARIPERQLLNRPARVARYLALRYGLPDQEMMGALFLDVRHRLISEGEIFRGTLAGAMVEPRTILKKALLCSAAAIVLFHAHPSGDPTPSREDVQFTKRMVRSGRLLGIRVLDHLILGVCDRWVSLAHLGFIDSDP